MQPLRLVKTALTAFSLFLAWVMGAGDPTSGTVSLHEVIRGFGALLKSGWKPLRNIVIASWDAEEVGYVPFTSGIGSDNTCSTVSLVAPNLPRTSQNGSLTASSRTSILVCTRVRSPHREFRLQLSRCLCRWLPVVSLGFTLSGPPDPPSRIGDPAPHYSGKDSLGCTHRCRLIRRQR